MAWRTQDLQDNDLRRDDGQSRRQSTWHRAQQEAPEPVHKLECKGVLDNKEQLQPKPVWSLAEARHAAAEGGEDQRGEGVPRVAEEGPGTAEGTEGGANNDHTPPHTDSLERTPSRYLPGEVIWRAGFQQRIDSPDLDGHPLPENDRRKILHTIMQTEQVWTDLHNLLVEKVNKEEAAGGHQFLDKFRLKAIQELQKPIKKTKGLLCGPIFPKPVADTTGGRSFQSKPLQQ